MSVGSLVCPLQEGASNREEPSLPNPQVQGWGEHSSEPLRLASSLAGGREAAPL